MRDLPIVDRGKFLSLPKANPKNLYKIRNQSGSPKGQSGIGNRLYNNNVKWHIYDLFTLL